MLIKFVGLIVVIFSIANFFNNVVINEFWVVDEKPPHFLLEILNLPNVKILFFFNRGFITDVTSLTVFRLKVNPFSFTDRHWYKRLIFCCNRFRLFIFGRIVFHQLRIFFRWLFCLTSFRRVHLNDSISNFVIFGQISIPIFLKLF